MVIDIVYIQVRASYLNALFLYDGTRISSFVTVSRSLTRVVF